MRWKRPATCLRVTAAPSWSPRSIAALTMAAEAAAMPVGPARMAKATINAVAHALLPLIAHRDGDQSALCIQGPDYAAFIGSPYPECLETAKHALSVNLATRGSI